MQHRSPPDPDASGGLLASYQTLHDVTRMLIGSASRDELFTRITRELKRLVPYDVLTIYRIDVQRSMFVPAHVVDRFETHLEDHPFPLATGFTGRAVEEREPINLPRADQAVGGELVPGTEWEPESLVIVPLMVRDTPIGTMNVSRLGEDVAFSEDEFELICRFAEMTALALDNTEIRERLQREAQTDHLTGLSNHRVFHERLRDEIERAARYRRELSLIAFDLDDFKQLNDVHGHLEGDTMLALVAAAAGECLRGIDIAFRVGGEEFAILLPETGKAEAKQVAERLCDRVRGIDAIRPMTVSCGVATFPKDGASPTELQGAADDALYAAKEWGKDQTATFSARVRAARRSHAYASHRRRELESLNQLKLLGAIAGKLNRLSDSREIGSTIVSELRTMIDYHNARVYLLQRNGRTLEPVAFGGHLHLEEYAGQTFDALRCEMGEGITGAAALRGQTLNIGDAQTCEFAEDVEGTADIEESIVAVPMRFERRTVGVIVLSKLGKNQFSTLSVRLLELLAAQAAVAFESAQQLEIERRNGDVARALLGIATRAADRPGAATLAEMVAGTVRELVDAHAAAVVSRGSGGASVVAASGLELVRSVVPAVLRGGHPSGGQVAILRTEDLPALPVDAVRASSHVIAAELHGGALVVLCDNPTDAAAQTVLAIAAQASLALRTAEGLGDGDAAAG